MLTNNRMVTAGETAPGQQGLAAQTCIFLSTRRKNPPLSYRSTYGRIAPGIPEGGGGVDPAWTDQRMATLHNGNTTTSTECFCGKVHKNPCGLKIHKTKIGCVQMVQALQRVGNPPGETQEELGLDPNHSAQNLQVKQAPNPHRPPEQHWVK